VKRLNELIVVKSRRATIIAALVLAVAIATGLAGYLFAGRGGDQQSVCPGRQPLYWYDPMIPGEHHPGPGKSSMGMEMIPKCANESAQGGVTVSPAMMQNLGVRVARVETRDVAPVIRAVGTVEFDERQLYDVQTLTPGFVENLSVRAEGEPIGAGRVVAQVYSPDLLGAQNEYRALLISHSPAAVSLRGAARSRLRLLGMPERSVQRLDRGGAPQRNYPVIASASGVVTKIGARQGAQVTPGQSIVTVQGLGRVLVIADVPEASLAGVHRGQPAEISFAAFPGEVRKGVVDYIFPSLDAQSRTARVRITLVNLDGRLRQGMFANVTLQGTGGMAVVVPSEAVIDTGRRRVVIVRRNGGFVPAEVAIGRDVGDYTQILSGVRPGEDVVVSGQFLIDSEASLSGVVARLQTSQPPPPQLAVTRGMVLSIDAPNGQVTISHQAVPEVGWPPMTMTFKVMQPSMLRGLERGSRVEFAFGVQPEGGSYVIHSVRPGPGR
jgi:Cu(I)/Ag(I) efflux system membrane fusion protein